MNDETKKSLRKKVYIDRGVQGKLIIKHIIHWCFYMSAILLTLVIWAWIRNPSEPVINYVYQSSVYFSPAIVASLLLLPLFLFDNLKESHRVVGPIHRIRNEMKTLADGGGLNEVRFRDGDHWNELANEFNRLANMVVEQRREIEQLKCCDKTELPQANELEAQSVG